MILLPLLSLIISPIHPLNVTSLRGTNYNEYYDENDNVSSFLVSNYKDSVIFKDSLASNDEFVTIYSDNLVQTYSYSNSTMPYSSIEHVFEDEGDFSSTDWLFGICEHCTIHQNYIFIHRMYFFNPNYFNVQSMVELKDTTYSRIRDYYKYYPSYTKPNANAYVGLLNFYNGGEYTINPLIMPNSLTTDPKLNSTFHGTFFNFDDSTFVFNPLNWCTNINVINTGSVEYSMLPYPTTLVSYLYTQSDLQTLWNNSIEYLHQAEPNSVPRRSFGFNASFYYVGMDNQESYQMGYNNGKNDGYVEGEAYGYSQGEEAGYVRGYQQGSSDTQANFDNYDDTALTIFTGIVDVGLLPINFLLQCLNFEVFGINIGGILTASLTVAIVVILFRVIFNGGSGGKDD